MAAGSDMSSDGDIPARKPSEKTANKQLEAELKGANEDEDLGEDEYEVESVSKHKFDKDGTLRLWVKWKGYDVRENTWEPEVNLEDCPEERDAYYSLIGGRPQFNKTPAKSAADKKRRLSGSASQTPPVSAAGGTRGAKKAKNSAPPKKDTGFKVPEGSWEDEIVGIDTMEMVDGKNYAFVRWKNDHRSRHPTMVVNKKCPQQMLRFYENHLQFNPAVPEGAKSVSKPTANPAEAEPEATNGVQKVESGVTKVEEDYDNGEDDEELNVKGVALAA